MFKKKKDNTPKLILAVIGAIMAVGGLILGLTRLKKSNNLECGAEEACCCLDEEETDAIEYVNEAPLDQLDDEVSLVEETEEESK